MAECASCGRVLTDRHVFCPNCGTPVNKAVATAAEAAPGSEPTRIVCPICATSLPPEAAFCGKCGTKLSSSFDAASTEPTLIKKAEAEPQPRETAPIIPPPPPPTPPEPTPEPTPELLQPVPVAATAFAPPANAGFNPPPPPQPMPQSMPQPLPVYGGYQGTPSSLGEYLAFRRMLTPHIGQIVFWLFEVINLLYWIRFIRDYRYSALGVIFGLLALIVSILIIRVVMEAVFVVFRNYKE